MRTLSTQTTVQTRIAIGRPARARAPATARSLTVLGKRNKYQETAKRVKSDLGSCRCRRRTRAEAEYHRLSALVEEIVSEDLARAAEF